MASTSAHRWQEAAGGREIQTAQLKVAPLMMLAPTPTGWPKGGMSANESHWPQPRSPRLLSTCRPGFWD